jgi:Protein of unknown function (DUF3311)
MAEARQTSPESAARPRRHRFRLRYLWYILLVIQFPAVLVPTFYTREAPKLGGIPFFYWYQFAWILVSVVLTGLVYIATREK